MQSVAHAANGVNERQVEWLVDLGAQSTDLGFQDAGTRLEIQVPDLVEQQRARHDAAGIAHQNLKQRQFLRLKVDLLAAPLRRAGEQVEREVVYAQHMGLEGLMTTAGERRDPGKQFREMERFAKIVVGSGGEPLDPVGDVAERREHQHGNLLPRAP